MVKTINRRKFFRNTAFSATGIMLGSNMVDLSPKDNNPPQASYDIMKEVMKYRKIDSHSHVHLFGKGPEFQVDFSERLGIEKYIISRPIRNEGLHQEFRDSNDMMIKAMNDYPGLFIAQFTLNVRYQKESLEEIKRCVDQGMVGLKLYHQVKINDPLFYPIIEKMIDLKMIILMHAGVGFCCGDYITKEGNPHQNTSIPEDFVYVAKRYPEAMFQYAHTGGGSDWEYACKAIKDYPNIYVDTSGSNNCGNMIDFALKYLGEDRLFFGTDGSYYQGVSTILASKLTDNQKKKIFFENYNNILKKSGNNVN